MSKKYFALLLMAVMMLFAVNAVAADVTPETAKLCYDETHTVSNNPDDNIVVDKTCTKDGYKLELCTVCSKTNKPVYQYTFLEHGHVIVTVPEVKATCTTDGNTAGEKCSVCNKYNTSEAIKATGHAKGDFVRSQGGSCDTKATDLYKCSNPWHVAGSGYYTEEGDFKHNKQLAAPKAPTCTEKGHNGGYYCACGWKDPKIEWKDPLGHTPKYDNNLVVRYNEGDCSTLGYRTYNQCARCDVTSFVIYDEEYNHQWTKGEVVVPGSCTEKEQVEWYCANTSCNATKIEVGTEKHTWVNGILKGDCYNETWVGEVCAYCNIPNTLDYNGTWTGYEHVFEVLSEGYKAPTCEKTGWQILQCAVCGQRFGEEIPALEHNLIDTDEVVLGNCKEPGGLLRKCTRCDYTMVNKIKDANGNYIYPALGKEHNYGVQDEWKRVDATCQKGAYYVKTCKNCGDQIEKKIDDTTVRHNAVLDVVVEPATCTTPGYGKYKCQWCSLNMGYREIPTTDAHNLVVTSVIKEASCKEDGEQYLACTKCDYAVKQPIPARGYHDYEEKVVRNKCLQPMQIGKVCKDCGATKDMKNYVVNGVPVKTDHVIVLDPTHKSYVYVAPCSEKQGVNVYVCKYCDLPAKFENTFGDHDWLVTDEEVKATCGQNGGYKQICKACGKEGVYEAKKADGSLLYPMKNAHTMQTVKTVQSNCHVVGYTVEQCTNCAAIKTTYNEGGLNTNNHDKVVVKTLREADCKNAGIVVKECKYGCEGTTEYAVVSAAHKWVVKDSKPATCEAGYNDKVCSECGATTRQTLPAVRAHKYVVTTKPATCEDNAFYGSFCEFCWKQNPAFNGFNEVVDTALGHTPTNIRDVVEATCTKEASYTYDCSVCGAKNQKFVGKTLGDHNYVKGEIVKADCTNDGGYLYTCTKCGDTKIEVIKSNGRPVDPKLGHKLVKNDNGTAKVYTYEGTCATKAYTYNKCERCGKIVNKVEGAINSKKHEYKLDKVLLKNSCTDSGVGQYICACGSKTYKVIPAAHDWDKGTLIEGGTCGVDAKYEYKCTVCGKTETKKVPTAEAHKWVENLVNDTKDVVYKKCSVCGLREVTADNRANKWDQTDCALFGHNVVEVAAVAPTCTETGLTAGTKCSVCDKVMKAQEVVPAKGHNFAEGSCTVCGAADPDCVECTHEFGAPVYGFSSDLKMVVAKYTCTKCGQTKVEDVRPVK